MTKNILTTTIASSALILSASASAWWGTGHSALCEAALQQVSPSTRAQIEQLLADNNTAAEGYTSFGSQCVWADDIKPDRPETSPWHYLNVPPDIDDVVFTSRPEQGDILTALETYLPTLADPNAGAAERLEALRFVGHMVGDLHQPMHLSFEEDWGGNKYRLSLPDHIKRLLHEDKRDQTNMHAVWDGYLLIYASGLADTSISQLTAQNLPEADGNYIDWANESLSLSRSIEVRYATEDRLDTLSESYLAANAPTAIDRLRKGAARLAALLERAFSSR
ncbi:MAG: S1/P1 nuclease [Halieaceae bacterium]|jgi:hypothetical protein|nr:S1/P1 nuclease [Halieaceae bacterium]